MGVLLPKPFSINMNNKGINTHCGKSYAQVQETLQEKKRITAYPKCSQEKQFKIDDR